MDSFNVSCGVSGISMGADEMVLLPLVPARFPALLTSAHLFAEVPGCALFDPWCLPLFGTHNTYGRLEDIRADWHTARLEALYGGDISTLSAHFTTFHGEDKMPALPARACGMYVHRQIWDLLIQPTPDEGGKARCMENAVEAFRWGTWLSSSHWHRLYDPCATEARYGLLLHQLAVFLCNLSAVNKMLMPTVNGSQYGNYYAERLLHETALRIIQTNIKEDPSEEQGDGEA